MYGRVCPNIALCFWQIIFQMCKQGACFALVNSNVRAF